MAVKGTKQNQGFWLVVVPWHIKHSFKSSSHEYHHGSKLPTMLTPLWENTSPFLHLSYHEKSLAGCRHQTKVPPNKRTVGINNGYPSASHHHEFVFLIVLWKIWDARNQMVFNGVCLSHSGTIRSIIGELTIWSHRLKRLPYTIMSDRVAINFPLSCLNGCMKRVQHPLKYT